MFFGIWDKARANKENIFYTIVTIFLLERVRRGWNRIEAKGKTNNCSAEEIERRQQTFTFGAALLYALPFLLPAVKYVYRSIAELSLYVPGLSVLNNLWAFFVVLILAEALLSLIIYNLLGIYVERMNGALGFFKKLGRSVVDGSKVAAHAVGVEAPTRIYAGVRSTVSGVATSALRRTRRLATRVSGRLGNPRFIPGRRTA
ncbi:MAG: hypothetical protein PVF33_08850 [Candidatus Latescibacterota bacterium]|jgi:hypothetical protein